MATTKDLPIGVKIIKKITGKYQWNWNKDLFFRILILVLTFISYMSYHFTRKPISVVKNVLHPNCTNNYSVSDKQGAHTNCSGWAPFDGKDAGKLFGALDSAFLFAYAFAMFGSGMVAERVNLRYFLSLGMILSGSFCYLFGIAKTFNIHSLSYFIIIQIFTGVFQTTGWPAVVTVVGHWFGKGKRGLIFGIWNSHTSLGNIVGTLIAGYYVETNWGYSFIVPGFLMAIFGFLIFLFLVVHPEDVGCVPPQPVNRPEGSLRRRDNVGVVAACLIPMSTFVLGLLKSTLVSVLLFISSGYCVMFAQGVNSSSYVSLPQREEPSSDDDEGDDETRVESSSSTPYRRNKNPHTEKSPILMSASDKAIGFIDALKIPGVIEFSMSLFFSKLVSYTFLYWLPYYISSSTSFSPSLSAQLSTLFDVGGIIGAIIAGLITDATNMSATVCVVMLFLAVPSLFVYQTYGSLSEKINIILLLTSGGFVNGPYALITTAVSAELGTHESLRGSSKALATVTAIIDGTGSIGAAVGPLIAGLVSPSGWDRVFYFLMASDVIALLLLVRLMIKEISKFRNMRHRLRMLP